MSFDGGSRSEQPFEKGRGEMKQALFWRVGNLETLVKTALDSPRLRARVEKETPMGNLYIATSVLC